MGHEMTHFYRYFQCPCRSDRPLSNTGHQQRHSQTLDTISLNVFPKKMSQNSFYFPFHHYFSISWLHYWEIIINNQFETPSPFDTNSKLKCTKSTENKQKYDIFLEYFPPDSRCFSGVWETWKDCSFWLLTIQGEKSS